MYCEPEIWSQFGEGEGRWMEQDTDPAMIPARVASEAIEAWLAEMEDGE
jgi:hypothetical protein